MPYHVPIIYLRKYISGSKLTGNIWDFGKLRRLNISRKTDSKKKESIRLEREEIEHGNLDYGPFPDGYNPHVLMRKYTARHL